MPLDDEERIAAYRGTLTLHCPIMKVHRSKAPSMDIMGSGTIGQQVSGSLTLTLYAPSGVDRDILLSVLHSGPRGAVLEDNDLFALEATDERGRRWTARGLSLQPQFSAGGSAVIRADMEEVVSDDELADGTVVFTSYSPVDTAIPCNQSTETTRVAADGQSSQLSLDIWEIVESSFSIWLRRMEGGLRTTCLSTDGVLAPQLDTRLDETVWFVLGVLTDWTVLEERDKYHRFRTTIRKIPDYRRSRWHPPLDTWPRAECASYVHLFQRFLRHILPYTEERFHPLSTVWRVVLKSCTTTIDDQVRALAVGVETLVEMYFKASMHESTGAAAEIHRLGLYLNGFQGTERMMSRLNGIPKQMLRANVRTALVNLVAEGLLTEDQRQSWEATRHLTAHKTESGLEVQALLTHSRNLYQALALLTFAAIGYEGEYFDYSSDNFRTRRLPRDPNAPWR